MESFTVINLENGLLHHRSQLEQPGEGNQSKPGAPSGREPGRPPAGVGVSWALGDDGVNGRPGRDWLRPEPNLCFRGVRPGHRQQVPALSAPRARPPASQTAPPVKDSKSGVRVRGLGVK